MKFGRNLSRNVVPEWSSSYIRYKALKKLIKSAAEEVKAGHEADLANFFYSLDRNLEDVDYFYNKKYADFSRRLKLLEEHSLDKPQQLDSEDVEDLLAALLELRGQLRKLQWYGEVNRRGFVKITKKLDKKVGVKAQQTYLETKVDLSPFATNARVIESLKTINDWLSMLGEPKALDDASSTHSSLSLKKGPSRQHLNLPPSMLSEVDEALRKDDTHVLLELLETLKAAADDIGDAIYPKVLKSLLQRSIHYRSRACISTLLPRIGSLDEDDDINKRNCLHRLVISIGRAQSSTDSEPSASMVLDFPLETSHYITPAAAPTIQPPRSVVKEADQPQRLDRSDPSVTLLQYILDQLQPQQREALLAKDLSGRTPLHYAAQYGFKVVCEVIIEHLQAWNIFDVREGIDAPQWQDNDGWAPLHLSVVGGHPLTTRTLLEAENWQGVSQEKAAIRKQVSKSSAVLALATKANFVDIVQLLVDAGVDINYQDDQGETALHVAARFGHDACAKILLEGSDDQKADTELAEHTYSWTPLFIACVDGALGVVDLLIEANADLERLDSSGWSAKEHAALRGHLDIARRLAEVTPEPEVTEPEPATTVSTLSSNQSSPPSQSSLAERKSNISPSGGPRSRLPDPIKTFGHRYLTDQSMILVSLGTMDMRKHMDAVNLDRIPMVNAHSTQLDTALSIVVTASGAQGEPEIIDLPVQESICTEPIVFHSADPANVRLLFDLVPTYAGTKDQIIGRGVALLSSVKPTIGSHRMNLKGDSTVPIVAANTLEVIGSVTFNFLIVTPFKHPNMSITGNQTYYKSMSSTMVIGHRGLGKNFAGRRSLQLGENTVQSFIAAANLGASYVEFDVQLTKDHVPVIYHDFLVSETGIDAPVHTLTLEQFLQLGDSRKSRQSIPPSHNNEKTAGNVASNLALRQRSMSVGGSEFDPSELNERIKHTRDFKKKGFKGNTRGNHIQAPFATLEELFKKLPRSVGFNMELKYPMLFESEEEEMDTFAVELNSFVDTVLRMAYEHGQGRNMIFSSFNPDICLLLAFKQPSIPVLFLSDSGASPVSDIRASSLQEAIRFASRWSLLGVVSQAEPLVLCPRLVRVVKESGLVCVSYGTLNNEPVNVKRQVAEGIDAVIVDSVLAIRKGLTEHQARGETPDTSTQPSPLAEPNREALKESIHIPVLDQTVEKDNHLHMRPEAGLDSSSA
ncbi:glycerophosphocholine phosphodiesterase [Aspergillus clavatus NRRL 1]|uniref:Cyclin dependent kinase (Pho85), putative n=1 Tax=Aspergillus clavatus (strain ATCC 1007 / CBS 513.65 / DSM 816 / NCTC 3887 / NRRL 1 / QM 1276 / 107) TaxID=344612 RepID=A1CBB1_ASPCL|nr:cyclin dependent kinase (Pho85), putative [Aspergillus clavatus NRRL 1]EAW13029.1 cyclin dependent kinase (Pho85), putative [Aspergillus clavatus NRRL 1]